VSAKVVRLLNLIDMTHLLTVARGNSRANCSRFCRRLTVLQGGGRDKQRTVTIAKCRRL